MTTGNRQIEQPVRPDATARRLGGRPGFACAKAGRPPATRPIRILHVVGRMGRGGAELRTLELFRHVDRRRYLFEFCSLSGQRGELDEEVRRLGGKVHRMRQGVLGFSSRFRRLLRRGRFDVVHAHLHFYSGYLLRLAAQCGVPVRVAHFRTSKEDAVSPRARRLARLILSRVVDRYATNATSRRWMDRYATHILGVSQWALESTWGPKWRDDPRCRVVYDGLDTAAYASKPDGRAVRREFGLPEDCPLYVHVGRMAEPKNHLRLIAIFAGILRRQPTARLLLIGRTVLANGRSTIAVELGRRIADWGITPHVVLAGERGDVPRLISAADVLLFPSLWEGLGNVVLEACAAGTPALAADLPSIREIASRHPGVRCLSLQESDATWAGTAIKMAAASPSDGARRAALERFAESVFTVERCSAALCRIWRGSGPASDRGGAGDGC